MTGVQTCALPISPKLVSASTKNDGLFKWKPAAGDATVNGQIRITPLIKNPQGGAPAEIPANFPVKSEKFKVV